MTTEFDGTKIVLSHGRWKRAAGRLVILLVLVAVEAWLITKLMAAGPDIMWLAAIVVAGLALAHSARSVIHVLQGRSVQFDVVGIHVKKSGEITVTFDWGEIETIRVIESSAGSQRSAPGAGSSGLEVFGTAPPQTFGRRAQESVDRWRVWDDAPPRWGNSDCHFRIPGLGSRQELEKIAQTFHRRGMVGLIE